MSETPPGAGPRPERAPDGGARGAAVGFVVARWLAAVCNVPGLCAWLDGLSWLLAAALTWTLMRPAARGGLRALAAAGPAVRLLLLTSVLNLAAIPLAGLGAEPAAWRMAPGVGLDVAAWAWVVVGAVAAARWWWGPDPGARPPAPARFAPRHVAISAVVVVVIGLQVAALFKRRPTWWPFVDYPLYSQAHAAPIRAVHYRLHGVTAEEPPRVVEITADDLGLSWFVFHLELLPRAYDHPEEFHYRLRLALFEADLPGFARILVTGTSYALEGGALVERSDARPLNRSAVVAPAPEAGGAE